MLPLLCAVALRPGAHAHRDLEPGSFVAIEQDDRPPSRADTKQGRAEKAAYRAEPEKAADRAEPEKEQGRRAEPEMAAARPRARSSARVAAPSAFAVPGFRSDEPAEASPVVTFEVGPGGVQGAGLEAPRAAPALWSGALLEQAQLAQTTARAYLGLAQTALAAAGARLEETSIAARVLLGVGIVAAFFTCGLIAWHSVEADGRFDDRPRSLSRVLDTAVASGRTGTVVHRPPQSRKAAPSPARGRGRGASDQRKPDEGS